MASNTDPTYTLDVTPSFDADLTPIYEATIYENRTAGVCGPVASATYTNLEDMAEWVHRNGFRQVGPFGPRVPNGFASAPLERTR